MARFARNALFAAIVVFVAAPLVVSQDTGPNAATTVQLPTFGVAIDAKGVLAVKATVDPSGKLRAEKIAAAKRDMPRRLAVGSDLRKVSLARLDRAIAQKLAAGEKPDEAMQYLAGLQRVQYVFVFPEENDIVIAGPAEGFAADPSGRVVGVTTGKPVLELCDLAVALRAYPPGQKNRPFVGCSIDPNQEGLKRFMDFQKTVPRSVPQRGRDRHAMKIALGTQEALGMADIRVFGIHPQTHFAQVLVEADYRMKRIGIGLEPPPVKMTTFIAAVNRPAEAVLQRWWFVPDYECLKVTEDRTALEMVGQGVQLLGEDKLIGPDGQLSGGRKSSRASELFTGAFTKKYEEIARASPVYAQMRDLVDMLIVAAYVQEHDLYGRANWRPAVLLDEEQYAVQTVPPAKQVACVANALWKDNRLLVPAGGGVSIRPELALEAEKLLADEKGEVARKKGAVRTPDGEAWWWD
ncbi:MAG: DUF1598 domain-containing protein [Planctomycetia bacterium]|nr:DUF1598 domain-containing protein [Planctomycetia bacterium]